MGTAKTTGQQVSQFAGRGAPKVVTSAAEIEDGTVARREIIQGLAAPVAAVSPKYFYDPLGSCLFQAITYLPEYYPTRTEKALMRARSDQIAAAIGPVDVFIDLGAGDCMKAGALFGVLKPKQYVAVDISVDFLRQALAELQLHFPDVRMLGVGADLSAGIALPAMVPRDGRLFFYPGSSIGNFTPADALVFLSQIREQCDRDGGLLIGVDLIKSAAMLNAAYDDPLGVTAAFNLNLLNNINGLIGSDFAVGDWRHRAFFNAVLSRIEMHLEARRAVTVKWPSGERKFAEGERVHTENSYKYALADFRDLLVRAGFAGVQSWTDENEWFAVCYATA